MDVEELWEVVGDGLWETGKELVGRRRYVCSQYSLIRGSSLAVHDKFRGSVFHGRKAASFSSSEIQNAPRKSEQE
jgi:hypothetical protein